ncbi:MAG: methyltransferase domain-containing protein [Patescibacteria group bacterium]|nr:methyltransferase domain-containing protein [Patescibacteria group bacterium]
MVGFGVLEHVENAEQSLVEIHRILKSGGYFFVFNLPQIYSLSEYLAPIFIGEKERHDRKYKSATLNNLLTKSGFRVVKIGFDNALPKRLKRGPHVIFLPLYNLFPQQIILIDRLITKLPVIRNISNSLFAVALKQNPTN